jgi:hypothetical protein
MAKDTIQDLIMARQDDPRALRGAIVIVHGKPRLTFGAVGNHRRVSVEINGNSVKLADDPRKGPDLPPDDQAADDTDTTKKDADTPKPKDT